MRIHFEVAVARDWWPWAPGDPGRMQGGTEKAVHALASALARAGHTVTARGGDAQGTVEDVRYLREARLDADALVCVQCDPLPDVCAPLRIAWSHAALWPRTGDWDRIVVASRWHGELLRTRLGDVDIRVAPMACGAPPQPATTRDRFLYAFSPDRGLHRLLAMWPALWKAFRLPLSITYDLRAVVTRHAGRPDPLGARLREIVPLLDQPGVVVHGPLGDGQLAALRARARAVLYPLDPVLPASELYSLSLLECCAAGIPLVLSPADALPSEYGDAARFVAGFEPESWVQAAREVLADPTWTDRALAHAAKRTEAAWVAAWEDALRAPAPGRRRGVASQRWLVVAFGYGPGEASLAREVVDAARRRGHRVDVVVNHESHLAVLPDARIAPSPLDVLTAASLSDRVVLSSSATCQPILADLRARKCAPPIVALDFTWPSWLGDVQPDLIVTSLSPELFRAGLEGDPPTFRLPDAVRALVRCVGPLAPLRGDRPRRDEVLVDLGQDVGTALRFLPDLGAALRSVAEGRGLTVRVFGPDPWLDRLGVHRVSRVPREEFMDVLAHVRLAILRPGAGTVDLARACGTPVLCVTPGAALGTAPGDSGEREAQVWFEAGLVEHLPGTLPAGRYRETIEALLDEDLPIPDGGGAERAVSWIEAAVPTSARPRAWRPPELRP